MPETPPTELDIHALSEEELVDLAYDIPPNQVISWLTILKLWLTKFLP